MTRRRRLLLLGLLTGLLAQGVGVWLLWMQPRSEINRENAEKIQVGMSRSEVETILGGPARDESTGPLTRDLERMQNEDEPAWQQL